MVTRLQYSRLLKRGIIILIFLLLSIPLTSNSLNEEVIPTINAPIYFSNGENATFIFMLNSSEIVRGVDDLLLRFQFCYENGSYIPDSNIYYNISNPSEELVFERTLYVNSSELFNETVIWSTFNSQPEGNYTIVTIANSTTTNAYVITKEFYLSILDEGQVRIFFPQNPAYLAYGQSNDVSCLVTNIGGTTVNNVTITNQFDKSGTDGSVIISHSIIELSLGEGATHDDHISFYPFTYLYHKYSFSISYRTIDEPEVERILSSDPLEIIAMPDIFVTDYNLPDNVTIGKSYILTYNIRNNQLEPLQVGPHARCDNINFSDEVVESVVVGPGDHHYSMYGDPEIEGESIVWFWIELEWETIEGTTWYTTFFSTVIHPILVIPREETLRMFNPTVTYGIIFTVILLSVAYFSRDVISNLARRGKIMAEKTFIESTYPLNSVILDGSNIAWEEKNLSDKPKISNIESMINRLSKANFEKIITVADAALRYQIDNQRRLDKLVKEGAMKMLPARVDGDKFILRLAEEENAMIVSNDMFKEFRETAQWIDQRRIPYTILDGEVYLHPTSAKITSKQVDEENNSEFV